jgi:glycosyltransferase involved in cell wall biosynthesis
MRFAYRLAARTVFTLPAAQLPWLAARSEKVIFIPVGANIPDPGISSSDCSRRSDGRMSVAVFGVTGGPQIRPEVADIAYAIRQSTKIVPDLRLVVLGRNSVEARPVLLEALNGTGVEISTLGLLPSEEVARTLSAADALLFVRGSISTRRGSAIAGIICGLPIVAYAGSETAFPITEAGLELVPQGDREALADALGRVLTQENLRCELRRKSLEARDRYFSWDRIAERYLVVLNNA